MIEDSIQKIQTTSECCLKEQRLLDEYDEARSVLVENSHIADRNFYRALCEELRRQDVLSEPIWSLRIGKTNGGDRVIKLILPDNSSTFAQLLRKYAKIKSFWFDFQGYIISDDPKIYLHYGSINFSGTISWEEQVAFLKKNNIRFDTSKAWEKPKGIKRKLKQLDSLYD